MSKKTCYVSLFVVLIIFVCCGLDDGRQLNNLEVALTGLEPQGICYIQEFGCTPHNCKVRCGRSIFSCANENLCCCGS
ncbi:hypothetical protein RND81_08G048200 [Saponaria officinalis]|uniref:Uncharacterized protein n=1 Tax=Saponaria officinalis TaxID=3572 RepID=A0AAW1J4H7_SAPOF